MTFDTSTVIWVLFILLCGVSGFAYSWMRARKRILQQYEKAVEKEMSQRIQQEILRSITQGPELQERVIKAAAGEVDTKTSTRRKRSHKA